MNMRELIRTAIIALIFFGIGAVAAESNLNTFTLRADKVLTDYIGGNATADKVNITGLIIQAGQILGYYNESATDTLLNAKANQSDLTDHIGNVTGNPHSVTASQVGAAGAIHGHPLGVSNVSGLQGILDDKYNISEVNTLLTGKSNMSHQHTIGDSNITTGINASKIGNGTVNNTEFGYLDGVASALQTQINNKFDNSNHTTATHNALNIDADTVDNKHYADFDEIRFTEWDGFTLNSEFVATAAGIAIISIPNEPSSTKTKCNITIDKDNLGTDVKYYIDGEDGDFSNWATCSVTAPFDKGDGVFIGFEGGNSQIARVYYFSLG